ncbi:MAG: glycosyl hydrolase [Fermentimonas sp.]|jgi:hypothetical protein
MRNLLCFILIGAYVFTLSCGPSTTSNDMYDIIHEAFLNPPPEARPKVYWWCLNGNIDTLRAREELLAMKEVGITGFDLYEIGEPRQDTTLIPAGPAFMSDESLQLIKFVVKEAEKLDLTVGLSLSSSWNAGGSWVKPEHAGKSLYCSKTEITGNGKEQQVKLPFPKITFSRLIMGTGQSLIPFDEEGKPEYYDEIAILALPLRSDEKPGEVDPLVITSFFDPETETLNWNAPSGNWEIHRYVCSNSGQQLVLPSPHSIGLTIDHFDAEAVETHLMFFIKRLQSVLGDISKTALKSFYFASYEARGLVWTPTLPKVFKELHGYEIEKYLPLFFNPEMFDAETAAKVGADFKKTLSELMINNLYKKSKEICGRYGLKINSEAGGPGYPLYNGPAEPLKAQGSIDIPRGEFWINHSRFYMDKNDSIDILRVVKEAAAASHIYEKGVVEMEAFTSFMHWQEGPGDMKPFGDRAFCEGMNRVVFHGFSHNITHSGYPGYVYTAGTHFNTKRVWWSKVKPFIDYVSRISALFQKSDFKADVVWYYGDKVPNAARPKNTHFRVAPGYDYEVINTEVLLDRLSVRRGKLLLANGAEFSLLVLEDEDNFSSNVLKKLSELVNQGALIAGNKPGKIDGVVATGRVKKMIDELWASNPGIPENFLNKKGKILHGISAIELLHAMNLPSDLNYTGKEQDLIDYIHFGKDSVDIYFIRNTQDTILSRNVGFRQRDRSPEIWDPVSGEINSVGIFDRDENYISFPISLPPHGSCLIVFRNSSLLPTFTSLSRDDGSLPDFEYTPDGINILEEGSFTLSGQSKTITVDNKISNHLLEGPWNVSFTKGWGAPEKALFPKLISWTDSERDGIKYYSGTATYEKAFHFSDNLATGGNRIYLDLGEIGKVADVWLNDEQLGISWTKPHRFDITGTLKQGENNIRVEVGNTWSNRLTGDALTGEKYTNTNMKSTIIPAPTMETGDQTRYPWAAVPLIESGLLGPVIIQIITPIAIEN